MWVVLAAMAIAAAWVAFLFLGRDEATPSSAQVVSGQAAGESAPPSSPEAVVKQGGEASQRTDLTTADLLRNAGSALGERRYISPPGNSAIDFYLLALGREPDNEAAQEGLRELFPLAAGEIEQKINAGDLDEGRRVIDLLGKFDPNNYTLIILRSKLDMKKKQMDREQERRDQEKAFAARNAVTAPAPSPMPASIKPASVPAASAPAPAPAPAPSSAPVAEAKPAVTEAAAKPAAAPAIATKPAAAPAPVGETRAAIAIRQPAPRYPVEAYRAQWEGWVEVAFTIAADGSVKNGSVVSANPPRVFNAAALRAIADWKFQPGLENGRPVEQQMRTRIEFKLLDRAK
ncbi:MAG: energy transducer TonB [Rudaea sp.]|uniref:energy transducer TonB n=1 Tax=Rudaea sp. TaxID=2136325 RepID=UPI0039E5B099